MKQRNAGLEWFIRALTEGDSLLEPDIIERFSAQLGLSFPDIAHFCVVVRYADAALAASDVTAADHLLRCCINAGKTLETEVYTYLGAHLCVVMLIPMPNGKRGPLVNKLLRSISRHSMADVRLGVGRSYRDADKISYSRVEAYEALYNIQPQQQISYIDDFYKNRDITTNKMESQRRKVVELFKRGQLDQMMLQLTRLTEQVRIESPVRQDIPYPTSIRRTVAQLIAELMHIGADAGVDVERLLNYQDPYKHSFDIGDTPELLAWFSEVAQTLFDAISERETKNESNTLIQVKKCIEDHLGDPELSLTLVSNELGITPTYFSAFFIREVGLGFNEYVTGLRIEKARQLLDESNKKIHAIASECGFRSASYFIVVFRKQTGMSPGEYRNKKN